MTPDQPFGDVVKQVRDEASTLLSQEVKLAKAEMTEKAKEVGVGAGMFGGADYLLHTVAFLAGAAVLALAGKKHQDEIRREIDEARPNLGEAVRALAYKADGKVGEITEKAADKAHERVN